MAEKRIDFGKLEVGEGKDVTEAQAAKAQMLVSMLGADFAKSNSHPFFRKLAETAVKPGQRKSLDSDQMSAALRKLVANLEDPRRQPAQEPQVEPTPEPKAEVKPKKKMPVDTSDIRLQHPALIAKHVNGLGKLDRQKFIQTLPGPTARLVVSFMGQLKGRDGPR